MVLDGSANELGTFKRPLLLNTKYITSSQNTTKFIALCCTVCYTTTCFGPLFGPSSGRIRLALRVMYSTKYTTLMMRSQLVLLWRVCKQFSMNGYRIRVWVGRDGIMFVSCFLVSIVVSGCTHSY